MGNHHGKNKAQDFSFTKPIGLYPTCPWPEKSVKKLILGKKLAPRYTGSDSVVKSWSECTICFRFYPGFNLTSCCSELICTECYLQVSDPSGKKECPFCSTPAFGVNPVPSVVQGKTGKQGTSKVVHSRSKKMAVCEETESEDNLPVQTARIADRTKILHEAQRQSRIVEIESLSPLINPGRPSPPMGRALSEGLRSLEALESFMLEEAINASLRHSAESDLSTSIRSESIDVPVLSEESDALKDVDHEVQLDGGNDRTGVRDVVMSMVKGAGENGINNGGALHVEEVGQDSRTVESGTQIVDVENCQENSSASDVQHCEDECEGQGDDEPGQLAENEQCSEDKKLESDRAELGEKHEGKLRTLLDTAQCLE